MYDNVELPVGCAYKPFWFCAVYEPDGALIEEPLYDMGGPAGGGGRLNEPDGPL